MVEINQHQQHIRHGEDRAFNAVTAAQEAIHMARKALDSAHPQEIVSTKQRMAQVQHEVQGAMEQIKMQANSSQEQQITQALDQLRQMEQELDIYLDQMEQPKQIR